MSFTKDFFASVFSHSSKSKGMKPIIFIPGIEATALVNANTFDFQTVWNAYDTVGTSIGTVALGAYMEDKLLINPLYDENIYNIIERNHIARLPYEKTFANITDKFSP